MIRKMTEKDVDIVNRMLANKYLISDNFTFNPYNKYYIYELDNEIVAYIEYAIMYNRAELNYIYVMPKHRKQKIATSLLMFMLKEVKNKQCESISLEVNTKNTVAISFYSKKGFVKKAIRSKYYGNEDALLMIREMI